MKKTMLLLILTAFSSHFALAVKGNEGGGGGNTLYGRPIESYIGDVTSYSSYKKVIAPLLSRLKDKVPGFANQLKDSATKKSWYFVPTKLDNLPNNVTGIDFKSDQVVVQSRRSVWIDKKAFDTLGASESDQSTLILHELVMGALMQHRKSDLTAEDHDVVRALTVYLLRNQEVSADELSELLKDDFGFDYAVLRENLVRGNSRLESFFKILKLAEKSDKEIYHSCESSFSYDEARKTIEASISTKDGSIFLNIAQLPEFVLVGYNGWRENSDIIEYAAMEGSSSGREGDLRRGIIMDLDNWGVLGYGESWFVCDKSQPSGQCAWRRLNDFELKDRHLDTSKYCALNWKGGATPINN